MKIALFLPNWIGDVVMATPALRAIRREFDTAGIVGVMRPYVADVLAGTELVDRYLFHEPRGESPKYRGWRFVRTLRKEKFDLAVLFPNSLRSAWLAWLSGAKTRVGFRRDGRGLLLTDGLKPKPKSPPHPVIDEYLRLAEYLGCEHVSREMELATGPDDEKTLRDFWANHPEVITQNGYVCLNPGGAFGAAKHWPTESFGQLAKRIAVELKKAVLVLCGPAERETAREITRIANRPDDVVSLADDPPTLGLTKAAIRHADLLVTTDSGPRHFAQPFDVPVVTLFGPTHIAWSETYYTKAEHLQLAVDCGPCQQRVCPLEHHRCMRELTVDRVFNATVSCLNKFSPTIKAAS
jgi:heptosyltransferase II